MKLMCDLASQVSPTAFRCFSRCKFTCLHGAWALRGLLHMFSALRNLCFNVTDCAQREEDRATEVDELPQDDFSLIVILVVTIRTQV